MYEIRQATAADWPAIADFVARTYGSSAAYKGWPRWQWQYADNPYFDGNGTNRPVWLAIDKGRVVGQMALQPGLLIVRGEAIPAGWIVDVMIEADHRGCGLGHRLHDAIMDTGLPLVTLTMALATRRIAERAGCITLPAVHQLVRAAGLQSRTAVTLLDRIAENRPSLRGAIRAFSASRVGPALAASAARIGTKAMSGKAVVDRLDDSAPDAAEIARLSTRMHEANCALFDRTATFLDWRLGAAPDLHYRWATFRRGGEAAAALIWRLPEAIELPIGTLVDIIADPADEDGIGAALDGAIARMGDRCEAIIAGVSRPDHLRLYRRRGFVSVKRHSPTVACRNAALLARLASCGNDWYFSKIDHDWDQVHPAV